MGLVGIIANPAAGKDIRRLAAHASTFDNHEKVSIVRRVLVGVAGTGQHQVQYMPDQFGIVPRALHHCNEASLVQPLDLEISGADPDSTHAAALLRTRSAGCIVTLGGDGTNRAVAKGCGVVPLVAISTGTNNVFPQFIEGTLAGLAAGAVVSGAVDVTAVTRPSLCLEVLRNGQMVDLALVDVAVCTDRFTGARAIWDPRAIVQVVSTHARSDVIGLSAIGGFLPDVKLAAREGLALWFGSGGEHVAAPLAPGLLAPVDVAAHRRVRVGDVVDVDATIGVLALDGEREIPLLAGEHVQVRLSDRGPRVVDVAAALRLAVTQGLFGRPRSRPNVPGDRHHLVG